MSRRKASLAIEPISLTSVLETVDPHLYRVPTHAPGPPGVLPLTPEMLITEPSGNIFGLTQSAGMGWSRPGYVIPSF